MIRSAGPAIIAGMLFILLFQCAQSPIEANSTDARGRSWIATGTVTKIDGGAFYFLGKDNVVYTIDASQSEVLFETFCANCYSIRVGDVVKVYGSMTGPTDIRAIRVRIVTPVSAEAQSVATAQTSEREVKVIVEPGPSAPATEASGPEMQSANWEARGLITDIDYTARRINIQTPSGHYTIGVSRASLIQGATMIPLSKLNAGDAVIVRGRLVGLNAIEAAQVEITRTRDQAYGALPQTPVSVVGTIQQIDYPSFTFKMKTESQDIVVAADTNTVIQQYMERMAFMNLKPGMRIKMSGYGSVGTGYAAQHIQIISVAP